MDNQPANLIISENPAEEPANKSETSKSKRKPSYGVNLTYKLLGNLGAPTPEGVLDCFSDQNRKIPFLVCCGVLPLRACFQNTKPDPNRQKSGNQDETQSEKGISKGNFLLFRFMMSIDIDTVHDTIVWLDPAGCKVKSSVYFNEDNKK